MRSTIRLLIGLPLIWNCTALYAAAPGVLEDSAVRSWNATDGLPEESIYSLAESPDGYIWIAIRDGLVRFDGQSFRVLLPAEKAGIRDNGLGGVVASRGKLWVGARDYVGYSGQDEFQSFTNPEFHITPFPRREGDRFGIAAAQLRSDGNILLRRSDGAYVWNTDIGKGPAKPPQLLFAAPAGESISALREGYEGRIWYATQSGIKLREGDKEREITGPELQSDAVLEARDGTIWAFAFDGLHHIDGAKRTLYPMRGKAKLDPLHALIEDRDGAIWAGLVGGVARIKDGKVETLMLRDHLRPDDMVLTLWQSRDGSIWGGSAWGTLVQLQDRVFGVVDQSDGLADSAVAAVAEDSEFRTWIGTRTAGVYYPENGGWKRVKGTGESVLFAMAPLHDGRMLLADARALMIVKDGAARVLAPTHDQVPNRYHAFSPEYDGHIYYNDSRTLYRIQLGGPRDLEMQRIADVPLARSVFESPDGIWVLSWDLGVQHLSRGESKNFPFHGGIERKGYSITELTQRLLLVATNTGVLGFDRLTQKYIEKPPIFDDEQVFFIQPDRSGNLWLAGRRSLIMAPQQAVMDYFEGRAEAVYGLRMTSAQGLPSTNFGLGTSSTGMVKRNGEVWLGSLRGAVHFRPEFAAQQEEGLRCAISQIIADGIIVPVPRAGHLEAGTRRLQVQFVALGRKAGENPQFRYRLEGDGGPWVESSSPLAAFTNLRPGTYSFQVQARVTAQNWTGPVTKMEVQIAPFWYEIGAVQAAAAAALVLGIFFSVRLRGARERRRRLELEERVRERTEDLAKARDEAEKAARVKADFLATMSHEIRTPMNGVIGMLQLLRETPMSQEQTGMLSVMSSSGEALMGIVDDILDLSKIEAGAMRLEIRPFSPAAMVEQIEQAYTIQANMRGIRFKASVASDVAPYVAGDANRIRQILTNLLSNALKFTSEGMVELAVTKGEGDQLHFLVRDTGIGIPQDKLGLIFEVFTQAESSTTRRYGGTGLGLAISHKLAVAMGGDITVHSKSKRGSEFCLKVPLPPCGAPEPGTGDEDHTLMADQPHVLVVEDNAINRHVAAGLLRNLGCRVTLASDGEQGVSSAGQVPYDLILMDCHMPHLDGYEATRRIRSLYSERAHTPIVAMTASALAEDRQRCLDSGMDGYLAKPIRIEELRAVVEKLAQPARKNGA